MHAKTVAALGTTLLLLAGSATAAERVVVNASEFAFEPAQITVDQGEEVTLVLENHGALSHNLHVEGLSVGTETIQTDTTTEVTFTPQESGRYTIKCTVPGHFEAGMEGRLVVR